VDALGWALIHFLWQGALIALALAAVLGCLRDATSQARYLASCAALLVMALCVPATLLWLQGGEAVALPPGIRGMVLDGNLPDESGFGWQRWVVLAWAAGAAALLFRTAMGWWVARRGSRNGIHWDYPLSRLMERMGMVGSIDLMVSRFVEAPQVFGWLKPVILIPAAVVARLSPAEMEAVLAHELAHIIRRDYLVNLIQTVVESLLFYHPAVWWVSHRIRQEREHCCDDIAVEVCGDRAEYSRALLKLEEMRPAFAMAATAGGLKMRIMRLMGRETDGPVWGPGVATAGALLLIGGLLWASQPPQPPAPPQPEPAPAAAPATPAAPVVAPAPKPARIVGVVGGVPGGIVGGVAGGVAPPVPVAAVAPVAPVVARTPRPAPAAAPTPHVPPTPPPPPPPPPADRGEGLTAEQRAELKAVQARVKEEQAMIQAEQMHIREDVKRELELALKDLAANKGRMEAEIRLAIEQAKRQLTDVNAQKEARASMEKALAELKAREPEIRKNIEAAMSRLQTELKDIDSKMAGRQAERERRIKYADERFSKGSTKGSETDRGRHYLRYGPPDEIENHAGVSETWLYKNWRGTGGKMIFEFDSEGRLKR